MPAYASSLHALAAYLQSGLMISVVLLLVAAGGLGWWFSQGRARAEAEPAQSWRMLMLAVAGVFLVCIITAWRMQIPVEVAAARKAHVEALPRSVMPYQTRPPAVEGLVADPLPFLILVPIMLLALSAGITDPAAWQRYINFTLRIGGAALACNAGYLVYAFMLLRWVKHG